MRLAMPEPMITMESPLFSANGARRIDLAQPTKQQAADHEK